jgi:hypothetical protein
MTTELHFLLRLRLISVWFQHLPVLQNDNCAGAITLTVGTNGDCNPIAGTVASATASPNASCGTGTPNDDVWYKFVVSSPTAILDVLGGTGFDAVVEAFIELIVILNFYWMY